MSQPRHSKPHRGLIVQEGHKSWVISVAFSPDGKSVASGSDDTTVRLWNAHCPSPIGGPLKGHAGRIRSVSYSPLGNMLASGSMDRTIFLWDTSTGRQIGQPLMGHDDFVNSVAISPAADLIASGSDDMTIRLWGTQSRVCSQPFKGHTNWVRSVGFSPDGTRVVSSSYDLTIRIWDIKHGTTIMGPLKGHSKPIRQVAFSSDGTQVVSGSWDNTFRLWDSRSGGMIGKPYEGHIDSVMSVAFSPSDTYLASGSADHTVRIWDVRTGHQLEVFKEHTGIVNSVTFSHCGRRIASGSDDMTVMIWGPSPNSSAIECDDDDAMRFNPKRFEPEGSTKAIDQHMSIQEMFDLLSRHGCTNLSMEMDTEQVAAVVVNGGGFGDVWMGKLRDETKVAIKSWRGSLIEQCDYKTMKRATREIHFWSRLEHPNIHRLMGIIIFRGRSLGMVSEWMDNGNLHEYMRRNPGFDRYGMCAQVASGVAYMHQCDVVHGDIKAVNVLVSLDGVAKIADFGLSTMAEASLAFSETSNMQAGSLRWAAPELLSEVSSKSKASDVYALGMTLLEIFSGTVPYAQCQRDFQVLVVVQQGILPGRPADLSHIERGYQTWNLLVSCWDRTADARPSAKRIAECLSSRSRSLPSLDS
ncbi:unnamed protein product [Rhizoctonia solani]|uniref:Protein kinase domain-containing protein n=1 Tax=Rhizoctonia solani TaxID=456999 RepID=A0A8H3DKB9_9AGAM|nr:unnamed protein product [Rhizoctonia solani]